MSCMKKILCLFIFLSVAVSIFAENGYSLWLRYEPIDNISILNNYKNNITGINFPGNSSTLSVANDELTMGLQGLLGKKILPDNTITTGTLVIGTPKSSPIIARLSLDGELAKTGGEGFVITTSKINQKNITAIAANTDIGVLYGVFHFLRLLQTHQNIQPLHIVSAPEIKYRLLNHWDNLNRTVERGYAGFSIWDWHKLPDYIDRRYVDYARANASIGIKGTVVTNVNANSMVLTKELLMKAAFS